MFYPSCSIAARASNIGSSDWSRGMHSFRPPDFTEIKDRSLGTNKQPYPSNCDYSRRSLVLSSRRPSSSPTRPRHSSGSLGLEPSRVFYAATPSRIAEYSGYATARDRFRAFLHAASSRAGGHWRPWSFRDKRKEKVRRCPFVASHDTGCMHMLALHARFT
jgi:hypothetical protein